MFETTSLNMHIFCVALTSKLEQHPVGKAKPVDYAAGGIYEVPDVLASFFFFFYGITLALWLVVDPSLYSKNVQCSFEKNG